MKRRSKAIERDISIRETSRIPTLDLFFAFGPMVPFIVGTLTALLLSEPGALVARQAVAFWGSAILLFLSGVRRGLSFRTIDGPTYAQLVTMLLLFCIGLGALTALWFGWIKTPLTLLLGGYTAVLLLDPQAAQRGEAPFYFGKLRRLQIPIALMALAICLCTSIWG